LGQTRVHIEAIRLRNFLSFYSDSVPFDEGLTVIAGPNGSGKTSIFHALKFALGSNQRENRYSKWSDFIRHGANSAEVEIQVKMNGQSRKLLRKIDRDGIPRSYVDGKRVKAAELRLLSDSFGLDTDNPLVFMPQERINALREMDPHEVRRLVEEGTGLDRLRSRIALQETEVSQSRVRLESALAESKSVEREIELLQSDLSRLQRKRDLLEQERHLEGEMRWASLEDLSERIEQTKSEIEEREAGLVGILEEQDEITARIKQMENSEAEIRAKIEGLQEEIGHISASLEQKEKELAKAEADSRKQVAELRLLEGEVKKEKGKKEKLKADLERISSTVEQYLEEKRVMNQTIQEIEDERAKVREDLTAFAEWNAKRSEAYGRYRALQVEIEGKDLLIRSVKERMQVEEAELHSIESKSSHLWDSMEGMDEKELAATKSQVERKIASLNEERFRAASTSAQLQKEIDETKLKLSEVSERIPQSVRELKEAIAEHKLASVRGPLVQLFAENEQFSGVIEAILPGYSAFSFITTEKSDFQLVQKLRDKTQAPSPVVLLRERRNSTRPELPTLKGVEGWLWDMLEIEENLRQVVQLAIGDLVLVSDLRTAIRTAEKYGLMVVSRDGHVVIPDEFRLVSNPRSEPTGLISAAPLTARLAKAENDLAKARSNTTSLIAQIDKLAAEREEIADLLSQIAKWSTTWEKRKNLLASIPELQERVAVLEEELTTLQSSLGSAERDLRKLDNTQPPERSRLVGQDSALRIRLRKFQGDLSKLERKLEFANRDEEQKRSELKKASENEQMLSDRVLEVRDEIKSARNSATEYLEAVEALKESRKNITSRQMVFRQELTSVTDAAKELSQKLVELNLIVKSKQLEMVQAKRQLTNMQYENENISAQLEGLEKPEGVRPLDIVRNDLIKLRHILDDYQDVSENVAHTESSLKGRLAELSKRVAELSEELDEAEATVKSIRDQYLDGMNTALDNVEAEVNRILGTVQFPGSVRFKIDKHNGEYGVLFRTRIKTEGYGELSAGSGGERSLIAISLILALQRSNPAPVYVMDEVDTFLDATNTELVSRLFHDASRRSQFILLTPAKSTHLLKHADKILGVVSPNGVEPSVIIESPTFRAQ
jgi:chromosome segregation protein